MGLSLVAAISFYSFQAIGIRENYIKFKNLFIENYKQNHGLLRCVLLGLISTVFLMVYATLTWFTTASGLNKLFNAIGATPDTLLAHVITSICTSTTMVVNTFSQVYKVFNPKTYVDLKEKFEAIYQPPEENETRAQKIRHQAINMLKLCALIGDSFAYSVAGGIRSGLHIGETLGDAIGEKFALSIIMAILSPVVLVFVSIAFTWPSVFDRKKSTQYSLPMEGPRIEERRQNNGLLSTLKIDPKLNSSDSRRSGIRFFDERFRGDGHFSPIITVDPIGATVLSQTLS